MNDILTKLNDFMYTYVLIIMLVAVGVYFTIRTRGVQIRLLKDGIKSLMEKNTEEENGKKKVSSFQALMISTASRVGTGILRELRLRSPQEDRARYFGCG